MKPNKLFLFLTITTVFCAGGAEKATGTIGSVKFNHAALTCRRSPTRRRACAFLLVFRGLEDFPRSSRGGSVVCD